MNINPKKSWHVRNKDNVAKVRKDEEEARLAEKEQTRRAALAEQEARTNYLRKKARSRGVGPSEISSALLEKAPEKSVAPLNFFSDSALERGATSRIKNAENEKEKKEEQIKFERKIGLLTFLGESAAEGKDGVDQPWYLRVSDRPGSKRKASDDEDIVKDAKRKSSIDPLQSMKDYVKKKKEHVSNKMEIEKEKKKKKKHKHKHKHRTHEEERIPRKAAKDDKLAKLREERLKREQKERERANALVHGETKSEEAYNAPGRYHSQFNPHLVRNRTKR